MIFVEDHIVENRLKVPIDLEDVAPLPHNLDRPLSCDGYASDWTDTGRSSHHHRTIFDHDVGPLEQQPRFKVCLHGEAKNYAACRVEPKLSMKSDLFAKWFVLKVIC